MERLTNHDPGYQPYVITANKPTWRAIYDRLCAYEDAEERGLLVRLDESVALAMLAGARAIEQNPRKYLGTTFMYDCFGENPKEITYYDAARKLREEAEAALVKDTNVPDKEG